MISPFGLLCYFEKPGHYKIYLKTFEEYFFLQVPSAELSLLVITREAGTIHKHFCTNAAHGNETSCS